MSELGRALIPKQPGSKYTNAERRAVIADYFVTGNITKTADMNNMPRRTVGTWLKSDWGVELLAEVRHEKREEVDAHMTKLIDLAFEQAQDRLELGDFRVSKDGKLFRVPMTGYQCVIAGATVYDKQRLHRNQATQIHSQGTDAQIKSFIDEYRKVSRSYKVVSTQENCEVSE